MQPATIEIPAPLAPGQTITPAPLIAGDRGADISRWNVITDWPALARDMRFLFVRATMGASGVDSKFTQYWGAAKGAGVAWLGVYHLFIKEDDPTRQADNLLRVTGGDLGNLPVVVDVELRQTAGEAVAPGLRKMVAERLRFLAEELAQRTGRPPIIYTSKYMAGEMLGAFFDAYSRFYGLFVADYSGPVNYPSGWKQHTFHQRGTFKPTWATGPIDDDVYSGAPLT